jgi:hypothetical protein
MPQRADVDQLVVKFTQFDRGDTLVGEDVSVPWGDFRRTLLEEQFFETEEKLSVPLLVPVVFRPGAQRKEKDDISCVTMGVLDYDELTEAEFQTVLSRLTEEKLSALVYSTWGHPVVSLEGPTSFAWSCPFHGRSTRQSGSSSGR